MTNDEYIEELQSACEKAGLEPTKFEMVVLSYLARICKDIKAIHDRMDSIE